MDRIILIDKPAGISSFGVVARVRRQLRDQNQDVKTKVGHTGTLDPFATGLLILLSGKMTRKANDFLKLDKVYEATIHLGATSSTGDPEGEISKVTINKDQIPSEDTVRQALKGLGGVQYQKPPIYSAIKINGQRAYKLARKGQIPDIPPREIEIYSLELLEYKFPTLRIRTHVSSGTYIRTLAEDIGKSLKVGAYCSELRRIKVGDYDVRNAQFMI